jgi:hypothetical protein
MKETVTAPNCSRRLPLILPVMHITQYNMGFCGTRGELLLVPPLISGRNYLILSIHQPLEVTQATESLIRNSNIYFSGPR